MRKHKVLKSDLSEDIISLLDKIEKQEETINELTKKVDALTNIVKENSIYIDKINQCEEEIKSLKIVLNKYDESFADFKQEINSRLNDEVPKKLSDLENDTKFITAEDNSITSKAPIENPKFKGKVTVRGYDVITKLNLPKRLSEFENDTKFITAEDYSIEKRALKPETGVNDSIKNINSYPFKVQGDNKKAAGITFDRDKYRINFGLDKDNKLKIGGGTLGDVTYEIMLSEKLIETILKEGLYVVKSENDRLILTNGEKSFVIDEKILTGKE